MNEKLLDKLEELFNELDNCPEIREMVELKNKIYQDNKLKSNLEEYRKIDNPYSDKKKKLKKDIIEHPLIISYRKLENELYFTVLEANQKLGKLTNKKRCQSENY